MNQLTQRLHVRSWWIPWLWIAILIAAGVEISIFPNFTIWGIGLVIPIAALLGWRYGHRGVTAVAAGGLPLLVPWRYEVMAGGTCLDVYLAALLVSALAASTWQGGPVLRPRFRPTVVLAFLLLPLSLGLYANDDEALQYQIVLQFTVLLYLFLFLLGLARYRIQLVLATLAAFAALGVVLELLQLPGNAQELLGGPYAELPVFGYTQLRTLWLEYSLDSPATFFAAVGWFIAGTQVALLYEKRGEASFAWYASYLPVVLLAVVGLGWETNTYLANRFTGAEPSAAFTLLGSFHALQCSALMGGLLLRWRGVLLVLMLLVGFLLLDSVLRADFSIMDAEFAFYLSEPIAVLGFGVLGIALRNRVLGTYTVWWSMRWAVYILIMAAVLPAVFSLDSALDLLWMVLGMIGSVVIGQWLTAMRKRYLGWLPSHGGWLALLALVASIIVIVRGRDIIAQLYITGREWITDSIASISAGEGWFGPDVEDVVALMALLIGCALVFTILHGFVRNAAACSRDVHVLIRTLQRKPLPAAEPAVIEAGTANSRWANIRGFGTGILAVARNITIAMIITFVVLQIGMALYPQVGIVATVHAWFTRESEESTDFEVDAVVADAKVNPYLWQAVRETFAQVPGTFDDRKGRLVTDWYSIEGAPGVRQQVDIQVGELLESYQLTVNLRRQQSGLFGLWVEQDSYWDPRKREFVGIDPYPQQQELANSLLARARELAQSITE